MFHGPLLLLVGGGVVYWYLSTLQPPVSVSRQGVFSGRTIEGGRTFQQLPAGDDYQPTTHTTRDIDALTGLPFLWVHKANGTKFQSFVGVDGVQVGTPKNSQA